jgi:hypothetical protein
MPEILDPLLTVEETLAEPTILYPGKPKLVPTLLITVTYTARFYEDERKLPPLGFGFWERIVGKGVGSVELLDVTPGSGVQDIPRAQTFSVEKSILTNAFGVIGPIPVQCRIIVSIDVDRIRREKWTNEVKLAGLSVGSSPAQAPTVLIRLLSWVERLITRREP